MKTMLILGAGFSKNSGIPIQPEIPELLIREMPDNQFENAVSMALKKFICDIFGYSAQASIPKLDDIFTCIDISTNSGHHLGIGYSPLNLRAIRRLLVYRVFSILENSFTYSHTIERFIANMLGNKSEVGFIVLNWDTALERYLMKMYPDLDIDYCSDGLEWIKDDRKNDSLKIAKIHGSCNWLYCDNCRMLIYDVYNNIPIIERSGIQEADLEMLKGYPAKTEPQNRKCMICGNEISSHIATFSYRKSFRANSFPNIWKKAEEMLSHADRWVFIGYSLPDADYEFKHLLKISELKFSHINNGRPLIDLVLLNSDNTIEKYKSFFGKRMNTVCNNGVEEYLKYVDCML